MTMDEQNRDALAFGQRRKRGRQTRAEAHPRLLQEARGDDPDDGADELHSGQLDTSSPSDSPSPRVVLGAAMRTPRHHARPRRHAPTHSGRRTPGVAVPPLPETDRTTRIP